MRVDEQLWHLSRRKKEGTRLWRQKEIRKVDGIRTTATDNSQQPRLRIPAEAAFGNTARLFRIIVCRHSERSPLEGEVKVIIFPQLYVCTLSFERCIFHIVSGKVALLATCSIFGRHAERERSNA